MNETQEPALGAQVLPFDKGRWGHSTNQRTATALSGSAVKDKIACGRRESMEFLKPVLGDKRTSSWPTLLWDSMWTSAS